MVKRLSLGKSTDELTEKSADVSIDPKTDSKTLLRYVKSAGTVCMSAESKLTQGDEEMAYVYFMKYMHVYKQLRGTHAYLNKNKAFLDELHKTLPLTKYQRALEKAEKLKQSLDKRYTKEETKRKEVEQREEERRRREEEIERELQELEKLKVEAAQPPVDAATLFSMSNSTCNTPLVPLGHSPKDMIPKEPYISAIELMHIIEAQMTVLLVDIRPLSEFKVTHVIHGTTIFISRDYLADIHTKLTAGEIRDLILMKEHKLLWDRRWDYDLMVIFDSSSVYSAVCEMTTHPINIIRECSTDCLDPNFMNTDLPKILDGGYDSWVYHFPKHCTNPDKARTLARNKKSAARKTVSTPKLLPKLPDVKSAPIYPELRREDEPKVAPLPPKVAPQVAALPPPGPPQTPPPATAQIPQSSPTPQSAVVTCGNVQINMQQTPQTIQINQWNQDLPEHKRPASLSSYDSKQSEESPLSVEEGLLPLKPPRAGGVKVTGVVPDTHSSRSHVEHVPKAVPAVPATTFPVKPRTPDPVYAQIEPRKDRLTSPPVSAVPAHHTQYADIRSIRPNSAASDSKDSSAGSSRCGSASARPPTATAASHPTSPPDQDLRPPPAVNRASKPSIAKSAVVPTPQQPQTPISQQPEIARPQQPKLTEIARPQQPKLTEIARPAAPPQAVAKNPVVNRVVKPLSAQAREEKNLRMMPSYGAVQQGTCGLKNIGNTCFMNAVLQCLAATAPLTYYFVADKYKSEINPENPLGTRGLVAEEYAFLIRAMWCDRYRHLAPKDWKEAIGRFRPQFLDYSQKDCQEFTSFMLDALHEDLNRVTKRPAPEEVECSSVPYKEGARRAWDSYKRRNDSIIVDMFQGQFRSITHCMSCGYESVTFDTFMYLTVPIGKSKTSLKSCIENFCQTERISEWRCDKCRQYGDAAKNITIWRLPYILVVILKRFSYSGMWRDKISTYVDFPVSNFQVNKSTVDWMSNPEESKTYRLFGVTNHTGTLDGGHYIGCARNPLSGDWFTYDDHVIRPMKADQTRKKDAYLLFYTSFSERDDISWLRKRG